jgi:multiple sugar transport system ATP-binding protein
MNFMPASVEGDALRTKLGDIPLSDELCRGLEGYDLDNEVILGVRPENFEDAALVPQHDQPFGITFSATIDVLESMGSDVFAYFTLEGGPAQSAELEELARDSGRADIGGGGDQIVARLDAATQIKEGDPAQLWVDARPIHIFDPRTGVNLALRREVAASAAGPD